MTPPLRIEYIPGTDRTGEPAWKITDSTGWPLALFWSDLIAKRFLAAINLQTPATLPATTTTR